VTRFGDFSPLGVFSLQKLTKLLGYFFLRNNLCINFDKKWVGQHFGRFFFTNASGHPASKTREEQQLLIEKADKLYEGGQACVRERERERLSLHTNLKCE
jgi:hypothetical protein